MKLNNEHRRSRNFIQITQLQKQPTKLQGATENRKKSFLKSGNGIYYQF
jgi:hypothetical protein